MSKPPILMLSQEIRQPVTNHLKTVEGIPDPTLTNRPTTCTPVCWFHYTLPNYISLSVLGIIQNEMFIKVFRYR